MSNFDLDYTYSSGRLQKTVDCSWGFPEFIKSMMVNPASSIQSYYDMWAERGLTAEVFEERKTQAECGGPQCSDPNTGWNKESCANATQLSSDCYCKCDGDSEFKNGKCNKKANIQSQSANVAEVKPPFTPNQILLGVGVGVTILVSLGIYMKGDKKDV
jgi:hypothetical protein